MKKNCMRFTISVLLALLLLPGCMYYKPAFRGKVIDAETEEPVEGAVVAAVYHSRMDCLCCVPLYPVGGSCQETDVRETLTDEEGMFRIPRYVTALFPYSTGCHTKFIIFKPGYGDFPSRQKSPPHLGGGMEDFFSEDFGAVRMVEDVRPRRPLEKVRVTFGVVRLPKMKTWKERNGAASIFGEGPLLREMLRKEKEWLWKNKGWRK